MFYRYYESAKYDRKRKLERYVIKILSKMDMEDPIESERRCVVLEY